MDFNLLDGNPLNCIFRKKDIGIFGYFILFITTLIIVLGGSILSVLIDQGDMLSKGMIELPFHKDFNYIVMIAVTIPSLIVIILKLRWQIPNTIQSLITQNIIEVSPSYSHFLKQSRKKIKVYNYICLGFMLVVLIFNVWSNIGNLLLETRINFQTRGTGHLVLPGYFYIFNLCLITFLTVTIAFLLLNEIYFLRKLVKNYLRIELQVLHPDKLGGLRPVAKLGLVNQAVIAIFGVNISAMIYTWFFLGASGDLAILKIISIIFILIYIILAPLVFLAPLWIFRKSILKVKKTTLNRISDKYNNTFINILNTENLEISQSEAENMNGIEFLYNKVASLPEWPFDWNTMKKFFVTLISPVFPVIFTWILELFLSSL